MTALHDTTGHDAGFSADFFASRLQGRALELHDGSYTIHISRDCTVLETETKTGTGGDDTEVVVSVCL